MAEAQSIHSWFIKKYTVLYMSHKITGWMPKKFTIIFNKGFMLRPPLPLFLPSYFPYQLYFFIDISFFHKSELSN